MAGKKYVRGNDNRKSGYIVNGEFHTEKEIKALREQIKLEETLIKLKKEHANVVKNINDITEAGVSSKQLENAWSEEELKNAKKLLNAYDKIQKNDIFKADNKKQAVENLINNSSKSGPQIKSIADWYNYKSSSKQMAEAEKIYNRTLNSVYKKYTNAGADITDDKVRAQMMEEVNKKAGDKINKAADKYGKFSGVMQVISDTFKEAVKQFKAVVDEQVSAQVGMFDQYYSKVSVREGINRGNWYAGQNSLKDTLDLQDLYNNINPTEVSEMWAKLSELGILDVDKSGNINNSQAVETLITQKIIPNLDATTLTMQQMVDFQPQLFKQIRGITRASEDLVGNSVYATKYIKHIVEDLGPVTQWADLNLGLQAAKSVGIYDQLREEGYTDKAISEIGNQVDSIMNNTYEALTSGTTEVKNTVSDMMSNGADLNDSSEVLAYYLRNLNKYANMGQETGNMSPIFAGMMASTGNIGTSASTIQEFNKRNTNVENVIGVGEEIKNKTETYGEKALKDIANDVNQTKKELQDNWIANTFTWYAQIKEMLGHWFPVLETAIKTTGTVLVGWLGTKLVGGLIGKAVSGIAQTVGGSAALNGTAATAGGTSALGIAGMIAGGVTLGLGAANVIKMGIESAFKKEDEHNISAEASALKGTALEGNQAAEILGGMASTDQRENNNFGSKFGSAWNTTTRWIGVGTLGWTRDTAKINQDDLGFFREKVRLLGGGPTKSGAQDALLAWTLLLASADRLNDIAEFSGITREDLKAMVENSGVAPSSWDYYVNNTIKDIGYLPNKTQSEDQTYIDWNKLGIEYHRYGLDYVPYDNYPAMLHQGETVLTASTASELRNLLEEYRTINQQSVDFDAIIQNQTTALVYKLDEIIGVIRNSGSAFQTSADYVTAVRKLNNSLNHISNTKKMLNS